MSGKEASRGFLYQGFASVLEVLTDERSWDKIYVEFPTSNDKVDIALEEKNRIIKCIQVKSTINTFTKSDIKNWLNDLIKDKESPEYKLFLIGQCNGKANTYIKSIKKYYENSLDKEADSSLGFDKGLLENRQICFSVLPFDIDILVKIVRDSLHKYISYSNRELSFEQIDFIASATVEDQLVSSTHGKGIDRKTFNNNLEKRIFLTADRYSPKRTVIEVVSFGCDEKKEDENYLSFIKKFDKRELKDEYSWDNDIYKRLAEFLHERTNEKGAYQLVLKAAHASIAFAAGRTLNSKSGINICPVQSTADNGVELWDVKRRKGIDYCDWEIVNEQLQEGQSDSALILNVTHNIKDEVISFIKACNLPIGRLISCIPKEMGATNISIKDGTHACLLANDIYGAIAYRSIMERRATMHIFASAPNAFMFFLGQNSMGFGKCILYEYDFEQRNSCTYSQSMSFLN